MGFIKNIFGGGKAQKDLGVEKTEKTSEEVQEEARKQRLLAANQRGRSATILGGGLADVKNTPSITRRTLGGS